MSQFTRLFSARQLQVVLACTFLGACGCSKHEQIMDTKLSDPKRTSAIEGSKSRELTHDETLAWINENHAWRKAKKTRPIWARAVATDEIGKEFQTIDEAKEKASEGAWLCVGVTHEPWFQSEDKIEAKYQRGGLETKQFAFDDKPHEYYLCQPKPDIFNWVAQVNGPDIRGFSVRPGYAADTTLHSARGGYVVKSDVTDPYHDDTDDVWLVQQPQFESTYEFLNDDTPASDVGSQRNIGR